MQEAGNVTASTISIVILTANEELNLPYALRSSQGWSDDIHVVDSGSTDRTIEIAREFNVQVHQHAWKDWADQRNWTLENCPVKYPWVLFLDADEQLTPAACAEIAARTHGAPADCLGFHLAFDFYFLDRPVRNAMHPHLRLVRRDEVRWQVQGAREYCSAPGDSPRIASRLIHHDHRGITFWIEKQTRNARLEARELFARRQGQPGTATEDGYAGGRERKLRHVVRDLLDRRCPLLVRPLFFFAYRLLCKTDPRDGYAGLAYAFFLGLWYPMLIDAYYIELMVTNQNRN